MLTMHSMAANEDGNERPSTEPLEYRIQDHDDSRNKKRPAPYPSPIRCTFQDSISSSDEQDGRSQGRTKLAKMRNDHRPGPISQAQKANNIFWYNDDRPSPLSQVRNEPKTPPWQVADVASPAVHQGDSSPSSSSDEPPTPQEDQQPFPLQQPQPWGMYPPHPSMGPNAAWHHYPNPGAYPYPVHQHGGSHSQPPTMPPSYYIPYANGWFIPRMPYPPHAGNYMPPPSIQQPMNTPPTPHMPYLPHAGNYMPPPSTQQPMNTPPIPPTSHESHNPPNVLQNVVHPGVHSRVRPAVMLYTPNDDETLSDYQVFVRKQIEFFEADTYEVETPKPGRKKPIVLGQVGIRCKHCRDVLIARRMSSTVYFPTKLRGLYQAAQNISTNHLDTCPNMSESLKRASYAFQKDSKRATAGRGGKQYWADAAKAVGIVESQDRLRFAGSTFHSVGTSSLLLH